jgi:hypothetical protein
LSKLLRNSSTLEWAYHQIKSDEPRLLKKRVRPPRARFQTARTSDAIVAAVESGRPLDGRPVVSEDGIPMSEAPFEAQPVVLVDLEKQGDDGHGRRLLLVLVIPLPTRVIGTGLQSLRPEDVLPLDASSRNSAVLVTVADRSAKASAASGAAAGH